MHTNTIYKTIYWHTHTEINKVTKHMHTHTITHKHLCTHINTHVYTHLFNTDKSHTNTFLPGTQTQTGKTCIQMHSQTQFFFNFFPRHALKVYLRLYFSVYLHLQLVLFSVINNAANIARADMPETIKYTFFHIQIPARIAQ